MADELAPTMSLETAVTLAEQAIAQGRHADAVVNLRLLLAHAHVTDYEYEAWAARLAELYLTLERPREAGFLRLYLQDLDQARTAFRRAGDAGEEARCFAVEKRFAEAGEAYLVARRKVEAAIAFESAGERERSAVLWTELAREQRLEGHDYERALVLVNLGLATPASAARHQHLAQAQRLLEQVADEYETRGQRDRAFDCYQILLKLGRDSGAFENVSEGYVNSIRVLREDGLKFYALQYYEDFVALALERGEPSAAALLYREAADYAEKVGLPYRRGYLVRAAETWEKAADAGLASDGATELVENALVAAIDCWAAVGRFEQVRAAYARLARLEVGERRRQRYASLVERFRAAPTEVTAAPDFPQMLRQRNAYADIWFQDLVEWEHDGQPEPVAAAMVGDLRYPAAFRRRALNLVLVLADARRDETLDAEKTLVRVAEALGELQAYAALRPLEKLYERAEARVRATAVRALRRLHFKRSYALLGRALGESEAQVRTAAIDALRALHFPHAFQPLVRIYREHPDVTVRVAALETLGRVATVEAGEVLAGVLRQERGPLRDAARKALYGFPQADIVPILRQQAELEANPEVRELFTEVLRSLQAG